MGTHSYKLLKTNNLRHHTSRPNITQTALAGPNLRALAQSNGLDTVGASQIEISY